ncbi:MAG: adenylate/guanylate cyclase domain-containing protein [Deltaproteobacteria bacterium]|nr:adenylate/guanylate cyclase domain-containing protein [Deltaproteobacteria bacterium]
MDPQRKLARSHRIFSFLLALILILLLSSLYLAGFFRRADLFLYDLHFKWRGIRYPSGKVVLVLMDQRSADSLGRKKGSWSRRDMARAVQNLDRAGAGIIGLDMVLFAPGSDPEADRELAQAIERSGKVVLAKFIPVNEKEEVNPLPLFQEGMIGDGFANLFPDQDGVLRKIPFLSVRPLREGLEITPSFSLEVARAYLDLDFLLDFSGKDRFRLGAEGPDQLLLPYPDLRINFHGNEEVFPRLSYVDVVTGRFNSVAIKGKIVLVGSSLPTDKDFFPTPFSRYRFGKEVFRDKFGKILEEGVGKRSPGVACHAEAVETILSGRFIERASEVWIFLSVIAFGIVGLVFYSYGRPGALWGLVILLGCWGLILLSAHLLFVRSLTWVEVFPALGILGAQYVGGIAVQKVYARKKMRLVSSLFGKYVSRGVVDGILKGEIQVDLEGRAREITVFFSDLRDFTRIAETLSPLETVRLLNAYFDAMLPIIFEHEGTLDKLMGDAIMAFFGAPNVLVDHASMAAETALEMVDRLEALKRETTLKGIERLRVGIGLNSGLATVGNLGSRHFMDYTVIGDAVNLGSRLEGLNKVYGTSIILSENTAAGLDNRFVLRELDQVRVKGKEEAVAIHELVGLSDRVKGETLEMIDFFSEGLRNFRERRWKEAEEVFSGILTRFSKDGPTRLYLERTRKLLADPPSGEWSPVTIFTTK